jgi:hypothetical protein
MARKVQNRLHPSNCNKAMCKTCMFGPTPIELTPARLAEIHKYLAEFSSSHVCHTTNKTCYGGLEFQAKIMYAMRIIKQPTVESMLEVVGKVLKFN